MKFSVHLEAEMNTRKAWSTMAGLCHEAINIRKPNKYLSLARIPQAGLGQGAREIILANLARSLFFAEFCSVSGMRERKIANLLESGY